jgi:23S rRNA pseudouridine1911/1915/1917 synthase
MKNISLKVKTQDKLQSYLIKEVDSKSKNNIKSLLKNKKVKVNNKIVTKYDFDLKENDEILIDLSLSFEMDKRLNIIYEDDYLIAIDKPSGLLSIGTENDKVNTAYNLLSEHVKRQNKNNKIFVIHRLDKDTSGVLLFAKNEKIKNNMQESWDEIVSLRSYIAVVSGVTNEVGTIKSWLKENQVNKVYSSNKPEDGKLAITHYKKLKGNKKYSMLDVSLETGRKNQIRVHMQDLGHPVVGDKKYGSLENPIKRLALHAYILEFKHPITNNKIRLSSKTPKVFNSLMR